MHDIKAIRDNPDRFIKGWTNRKLDGAGLVKSILELDEGTRILMTELQNLLQQRNEKSKAIGSLKSTNQDATFLVEEVTRIKSDIPALEKKLLEESQELQNYLETLPNIMQDDVPVGLDETANVEIHKWGTPTLNNAGNEHFTIGENLGMMNFDAAAKMSGSRFTVLHSGLARLERALGQFMIDTHVNDHGYTEVSAPLMVRDDAMYGVGMLPKFGEDMFKTNTDHWLIPTSEAVLTNMVMDMIVDAGSLPLRMTAMTPCFRSEAGSAGKDTRGMIRQHQFYKVEMVSITRPDQSRDEHERMTRCAETILEKLELPYRRIVLCTGDAGFCSQKTYDLEVWLPGQGRYREISSCSNCGDFQARRMNARTRLGEKGTTFVHTLNGSGVAVGRALIAVIENYYNEVANAVKVPKVLQPYMNGAEWVQAYGPGEAFLRSANG